jgi:hypothetical protein
VGDDRPLLNWVAYALASKADPEFIWTDVRTPGQLLRTSDVLSRQLVPPDRLRVVGATELAPNDREANVAVSTLIRSDEPPSNVQRLLDFLRLPLPTQRLLETVGPPDRVRVCVLSNGQRILALYPSSEAVRPTIRAIVDGGVALVMTFADEAPKGRLEFDNVLAVDGSVSGGWKGAVLTVEKWTDGGDLRVGSTHRLGEVPAIASVLSRELG